MPLTLALAEGPLTVTAVIFDMDGLLIDSETLSIASWRDTLALHHVDLNEQDVLDMFGQRIIDDAKLFVDRYQLTLSPTELVAQRDDMMFASVQQHLELMPGALELLQALQLRQIPLALATSGTRDYATLCLNKTQVASYFPVRLTGDMVEHGKPAPDIFLAAALAIQVQPQQCLVLEDAPHGVAAAVAAQMPVIAVPNIHTQALVFGPRTAEVASLYEVLNLFAQA